MAAGIRSVVFPSNEDFDNVAAVHDEIYKWTTVPLNRAFRILAVTEIACRNTFVADGDAVKMSRVARLCDADGTVMTVWLPTTIEKQLMTYSEEDVADGRLFIRSLGPKVSQTTGYSYYNFKILKSH